MTDSHTHTHMLLINLSLVNSSFNSTLKESLWETLAPKKEITTAVFLYRSKQSAGKHKHSIRLRNKPTRFQIIFA